MRDLLWLETSVVLGTAFIVAGITIPEWAFKHPKADATTLILWFVASIGTLIVLMVLIFVWTAAWAPVNASRAKRAELERLQGQIGQLEGRIGILEDEHTTKFAAAPKVGQGRNAAEHQHRIWAALDVTNLSTRPSGHMRDVEIRIKDVVSELEWIANGHGDQQAFQSIWSTANSKPNQQKIAIPPGQTRTAIIAYSDDENGLSVQFSRPADDVIRPLPSGPHRVSLSISSPDSAGLDCDFYIECHPPQAVVGKERSKFAQYESSTMSFEEWDAYEKRQEGKDSTP